MLSPARALTRATWRLAATLSLVPGLAAGASAERAGSGAYVRINGLGYVTTEDKLAIVMAGAQEDGATFSLISATSGRTVFSAPIGATRGRWSHTFPFTYSLDFSTVTSTGRYFLQVDSPAAARSPTFPIASAATLYIPLLANARFFYRTQRDGPDVDHNVMGRVASHLADERASIYRTPRYTNGVLHGTLTRIGGPIDVSGGWLDAGDYVKFVATASYVDAVLLFAARQYPGLVGPGSAADFAAEGRYGLDWLRKMWDGRSKTLYYQVGIGDGNGTSILGDHDFFRLPQADDALGVKPGDPAYFVKYRPVFRAGPPGSPISPNLAGRLAADFALCYQLFHVVDPTYAGACLRDGEAIFDLAKTGAVGQLLTATVFDYYPEQEWRDDLELGATELYFATTLGPLPPGLPHPNPAFYLRQAAHWADAYMHSPLNGADSLNFYDVGGLAHYELYRALARAGNPDNLETTQGVLLKDLDKQLRIGSAQAARDPFGLGIAYGSGDATPHALGLALEAGCYDELAGTSTYRAFAQQERNWALGSNAWGSSFIVGAGSTFPHCMQHQVANLAGSLDGGPPIVLGATVDGPSAIANFNGLGMADGMRACPPGGGDPFAPFTGLGVAYRDNVIDWPSVEPADDYTALTVPLFARQALGLP